MTKLEINIDSILLTTDFIRIWMVFPVMPFFLFQDPKLHLVDVFLVSETFF